MALIAAAAALRLAPREHTPLLDMVAAIEHGDYRAAYALTSASIETASKNHALSLEHFTAYWRARGADGVEIVERGSLFSTIAATGPHGRETMTLSERDGLVQTVQTLEVKATTGPLPGLTVDGVAVALAPPQVEDAPSFLFSTGLKIYRYRIATLPGKHTFEVAAFQATRPFRTVVNAGPILNRLDIKINREPADLEIALQASAPALARARALIDAIRTRCDATCLALRCEPMDRPTLPRVRRSTLRVSDSWLVSPGDDRHAIGFLFGGPFLRMSARGTVLGVEASASQNASARRATLAFGIEFPPRGAPRITQACIV